MTDSNKTYAREYNMDILRVLLIIFVIVLHYNNRGMGGALNFAIDGSIKEFAVRFSESLCICAVDGFLMLSGYFADNKRGSVYKKAFLLLFSCSFYRTVAYILHVIFVTGEFSVRTLIGSVIPSNWFVCMFVGVLLLCPYIDRLLNGLEKSQLNKLAGLISVLFVIVPTVTELGTDLTGADLTGLSTITFQGDIEGFTIVSMLYCYIIGYTIKKQNALRSRIAVYVSIAIYFAAALFSAFLSYKSEAVWSYSNIFTVLEAVSLLIIFMNVSLKGEMAGRVFSQIGACGLGIFVWHTSPLMIYGFWVYFNIPVISNYDLGGYLANLFLSVMAMFFVSLAVVFACRNIFRFFKKKSRS